mgnify:CR=1 FL=1
MMVALWLSGCGGPAVASMGFEGMALGIAGLALAVLLFAYLLLRRAGDLECLIRAAAWLAVRHGGWLQGVGALALGFATALLRLAGIGFEWTATLMAGVVVLGWRCAPGAVSWLARPYIRHQALVQALARPAVDCITKVSVYVGQEGPLRGSIAHCGPGESQLIVQAPFEMADSGSLLWLQALPPGIPAALNIKACLARAYQQHAWSVNLALAAEAPVTWSSLKGAFSGDSPVAPLERFTDLHTLDLAHSFNIRCLPSPWFGVAPLVLLDLSASRHLAELPEAIAQTPTLQTLNLAQCLNLVRLPAAIGQLAQLRRLDLSYCGQLTALPESIGQLSQLTSLNLDHCNTLLAAPDGLPATAMARLSVPTELALGDRTLSCAPRSLQRLCALEDLHLVYTECLTELPCDLPLWLPRLRTLNLRTSSITALPEAIGQLSQLTTLALRSCTQLTALPESIGDLVRLTLLNLLGSTRLAPLPESLFSGCVRLTVCHLPAHLAASQQHRVARHLATNARMAPLRDRLLRLVLVGRRHRALRLPPELWHHLYADFLAT